ncbi:cinnamoyl-CoA reductase-like SNL6 [Cannabis sativa]|uniref:3-beta hydroxysteroid dehydrogenase/isomerase domain-containing protein n=1 Tax=Cannabis sativa TaxID=3483 RepID=A0A803PPV2_CANSA|nr:cinnamoyl-CoA reductase-like SNL6 [Cannabis sativa]
MMSSKTVCVMDASGRLGSNLVNRLIQRGYTVHAAIQSHGDPLLMQSFKSNKVRIFDCDLLDYHSIMNALKGCYALFYCFEPPYDHTSYDEFMGEVEVRAAHNVLEACAQTHTIHKVIFTSSVTAVIWRDQLTNTIDFDERNWSDINLCKKLKLWHALSKTLAEKTAWALAMDRGLNMVSINGGLLMTSHLTITNPYLKGAAEMYENGVLVTVDLKFVVDAHICVFEDNNAYGRYLCFDRVINCNQDTVELARILSPPSSTNVTTLEEDVSVYQQRITNKKLNKLMVDFDNNLL